MSKVISKLRRDTKLNKTTCMGAAAAGKSRNSITMTNKMIKRNTSTNS